jgi:uncharacterized protein YqjF (DUF2071 family)
MDRIAPSRRPEGPNAGTQRWRQLLFLHWTLPVEEVRRLVPASLELDLWNGEAYVGVVPFKMERVRPRLLPEPLALDFLETNLRTYVHRDGVPGVYFFSLEAASRLAVAVARLTFGLPYWFARMQLDRDDAGNFTYDTVREKKPARHRARYRTGAELEKGPLEAFLIERYALYVERRGKLQRAYVNHTPYPLRSVEVLEVEDGLIAAAGMSQPSASPRHACFSDGVDVEVFAPRDVDQPAPKVA